MVVNGISECSVCLFVCCVLFSLINVCDSGVKKQKASRRAGMIKHKVGRVSCNPTQPWRKGSAFPRAFHNPSPLWITAYVIICSVPRSDWLAFKHQTRAVHHEMKKSLENDVTSHLKNLGIHNTQLGLL